MNKRPLTWRHDLMPFVQIVRDKRSGKSKGFGFVSIQDVEDFAKAMREMNGKYIGNRPCKLSKSTWDQRSDAGYNPKKVRPKA